MDTNKRSLQDDKVFAPNAKRGRTNGILDREYSKRPSALSLLEGEDCVLQSHEDDVAEIVIVFEPEGKNFKNLLFLI